VDATATATAPRKAIATTIRDDDPAADEELPARSQPRALRRRVVAEAVLPTPGHRRPRTAQSEEVRPRRHAPGPASMVGGRRHARGIFDRQVRKAPRHQLQRPAVRRFSRPSGRHWPLVKSCYRCRCCLVRPPPHHVADVSIDVITGHSPCGKQLSASELVAIICGERRLERPPYRVLPPHVGFGRLMICVRSRRFS